MKPSDFERHTGTGQRRFLWRSLNGEFQVYGLGLHHIATCETAELAAMVADALEVAADSTSGTIRVRYLPPTPIKPSRITRTIEDGE